MKEIATITSLWEYLECINNLVSNFTNSKGQTPHLWYRGHACTEESNKNWKLIPSIQRVLAGYSEDEYYKKEQGMNNDFQSRASVF